MGLSDLDTEGVFLWDDGEPMTREQNSLWSEGEPNDRMMNEDCGELSPTGLTDVDCTLEKRFLCTELPMDAPSPGGRPGN